MLKRRNRVFALKNGKKVTILIEREHDLHVDDVAVMSEQIADELANKYGIEWSWQDDRLIIDHMSARGFLHSQHGKITIQLKLGFAASLFASSIENSISKRLDQLLITQ